MAYLFAKGITPAGDIKYYIPVLRPNSEATFTQPKLTNNGSMGGDSFAVDSSSYGATTSSDAKPAWGAFDESQTTYWRASSTTAWITFYNPKPLRVNAITVTPFYSAILTAGLEGSNNNSDWVTLGTGTPNGTNAFTIKTNSTRVAYKYFRLNLTSSTASSQDRVHIRNIAINAKEVLDVQAVKYLANNTINPTIEFIQPTLTANGTIGGTSFAVGSSDAYGQELAYRAFDGIVTNQWSSNNTVPARLRWYNPKPLFISKLTVTNRNGSGSIIKNYDIQYADLGDDTDWVTLQSGTNTNTQYGGQWDITINHDQPHKHWRIIAQSVHSIGWAGSVSVAELKITGRVRRGDEDFIQPALKANGSPGGTSFAVSRSSYASNSQALCKDAYGVFDGDKQTYWRASGTNENIVFYYPIPLKVKSIVITPFYSAITTVNIEGSNTNGDWVQLASMNPNTVNEFTLSVNSSNAYKYHRVTFTVASGNVHIADMQINAKEVVQF